MQIMVTKNPSNSSLEENHSSMEPKVDKPIYSTKPMINEYQLDNKGPYTV